MVSLKDLKGLKVGDLVDIKLKDGKYYFTYTIVEIYIKKKSQVWKIKIIKDYIGIVDNILLDINTIEEIAIYDD